MSMQETTTPTTPAPPRERPSPQRALGRFTPLAAIAAVVLITLLAGALFVRSGNQRGGTGPSAGTVSATISGLGVNGNFSLGMAADDTTLWVHNGDTGALLRINPTTNTVVATISVGHGDGGVAIDQGAVWVANPTDGTVSRVDPQTNQVVATVALTAEDNVQAITVSPGAVWVTDFAGDRLLRIDPQTNKVAATIPNMLGITGVAYGAGSVWVCNHHDFFNVLTRLNPQTNQVQAKIAVEGFPQEMSCGSVVATAQVVWMTSFVNGDGSSIALKRIDPATNTVTATIPTPGATPFHFAADAQGVWLFDLDPGVGLYRVDPTTNRRVGPLALSGANGVGVGAGAVWVGKSDGTLLRITPAS